MSTDWYKNETDNNPDIIVTLVAKGYRAQQIWEHRYNEDRYVSQSPQATDGGLREMDSSPRIRVRGVTPSPEDPNLRPALEPATRFTFSKPPKNPELGYLLGSDEKACDMFLGFSDDCISRRMFCITFNRYNEVVMQSSSGNETEVCYIIKGKQQKATRKNFAWIFPPEVDRVFVNAARRIQFQIILPTHRTDKAAFDANCQNFMKLANSASYTLGQLNLSSRLETRLATGTASSHATPERPFYLRMREIGDGGFGVVYKARSMPDGETVAVKRFKSKSAWTLEADVLRKLSKVPHKNIVKFIDFELGDKPFLVMGLAPGGNLDQQHKSLPFTIREVGLILRQMLDALIYLHVGFNITHRDIKPANILCDSRAHFRLADFGLAKEGDDLKTCLGTAPYMAPEMFANTSYTDGVDLWALGMVIALLLTPQWPHGYRGDEGLPWCAAVVAHYKAYGQRCQATGNDTAEHFELNFLVQQYMLKIDPEERWSAFDCANYGSDLWQLLDQENSDGNKTPTLEDPTGSLPEKPRANNVAGSLKDSEPARSGGTFEESGSWDEYSDCEEENGPSGNNRTDEKTEVPRGYNLKSSEWESLERQFPIKAAKDESGEYRMKSGDWNALLRRFSSTAANDEGGEYDSDWESFVRRFPILAGMFEGGEYDSDWDSLVRRFPILAGMDENMEVRSSGPQHCIQAPSVHPHGTAPEGLTTRDLNGHSKANPLQHKAAPNPYNGNSQGSRSTFPEAPMGVRKAAHKRNKSSFSGSKTSIAAAAAAAQRSAKH